MCRLRFDWLGSICCKTPGIKAVAALSEGAQQLRENLQINSLHSKQQHCFIVHIIQATIFNAWF